MWIGRKSGRIRVTDNAGRLAEVTFPQVAKDMVDRRLFVNEPLRGQGLAGELLRQAAGSGGRKRGSSPLARMRYTGLSGVGNRRISCRKISKNDVYPAAGCAYCPCGNGETVSRFHKKEDNCSMEMPLGLGMALVHNQQAMMLYAALTDKERQAVIDGAKQVRSPADMRAYVDQLASRKGQEKTDG